MVPPNIPAPKTKRMRFLARVRVMPHKALLDPQGKAVQHGLGNLGLKEVQDVRVGKHITLELDAPNAEAAKATVEKACSTLLSNPVMEYAEFDISPLS